MTEDIATVCRREAGAWIIAGIGDGWPLHQAADEIDRLRAERDELQALIDAAAPLLVYYGDGRSVAADDVRIVDALLAAATKEDDRE